MSYYKKKLSAERLKACYDLAGPRIHQYLKAESNEVASLVSSGEAVLELGCGYGRVFPEFDNLRIDLYGIDYAIENLLHVREYLCIPERFLISCMDAAQLGFADNSFDLVFCIQNGICAFHVDQRQLIAESLRVTKPGGRVLLSTYSEKIWDARLEWFEQQAAAGLLGEIDNEKTANGRIVCKDGFSSSSLTLDDFLELTKSITGKVTIAEVDNSSLFCTIAVD